MPKMTYAQQLAHPSWQRRRLEILAAANWKCACCGDAEEQLHVHHRTYFKGRKAWEYADNELIVLCATCHELEHEAKEALEEILLAMPPKCAPVKIAIALLGNYFAGISDIYAGDPVFDVVCQAYDKGFDDEAAGMGGTVAAMLRGLPVRDHIEVMGFINGLRAKAGLDER